MSVSQVGTLIQFTTGSNSVADLNTNLAALRTQFNNLVTGTDTLGSGLTIGSVTFSSTATFSSTVAFSTAASQIIPGATSLSLRNTANSADNLLVADVGDVTLRTKLTMPGPLVLTTTASQIVPGATSLSLRNTANNADNLLVADVGDVTVRHNLTVNNTLTVSGNASTFSAGSGVTHTLTVGQGGVSSGGGAINIQHESSGTSQYQVNGTKVVSDRRTGWTAWTGTPARGTQNADGPPTATQIAQAFKALLDDLIAHGLVGA